MDREPLSVVSGCCHHGPALVKWVLHLLFDSMLCLTMPGYIKSHLGVSLYFLKQMFCPLSR